MEANPVGKAVHEDTDGKLFFNSFELDSDVYSVKDCVRINITEEEDDEVKFDFGQILKDSPHPQRSVSLGFLNTNVDESSSFL